MLTRKQKPATSAPPITDEEFFDKLKRKPVGAEVLSDHDREWNDRRTAAAKILASTVEEKAEIVMIRERIRSLDTEVQSASDKL